MSYGRSCRLPESQFATSPSITWLETSPRALAQILQAWLCRMEVCEQGVQLDIQCTPVLRNGLCEYPHSHRSMYAVPGTGARSLMHNIV